MNCDTTILVNTCDDYHDVLPIFFCAIQEFWKGHNFPINLNSEYNCYVHSGIDIFSHTVDKNEKLNWGYRFKKTLSKLNHKFVINLADDYILESIVEKKRIDKILRIMVSNEDIGAIYLYPILPIKEKMKRIFDDFVEIKHSTPYSVNTSPAIWRKDFLNKLINEKDDPWSWEFFADYTKFSKTKKILSICDDISPIYQYAANKGGGIYRGKWVEDVIKPKILKYNLNIDLKKRSIFLKNDKISRPFFWKLKFILNGIRMTKLNFIMKIFNVYLRGKNNF